LRKRSIARPHFSKRPPPQCTNVTFARAERGSHGLGEVARPWLPCCGENLFQTLIWFPSPARRSPATDSKSSATPSRKVTPPKASPSPPYARNLMKTYE